MKSFQTKLILAILLIFLVALSTLGGLSYWKARSIIIENVGKDMTGVAETSANSIGTWLEARKSEISMLSVSPDIQSGNQDSIMPLLINAAKANPSYDDFSYADTRGEFISSSGSTGSFLDREHFQKGIKGEATITGPLVSKATGHLIVVVAIPVKVNDKVIGVIYGGVKLEGLNSQVMAVKVGKTGYALVAQQDGLTIIHPDKEVAMKANSLTDPKADPSRKAITEKITKGEKGLVTLQALGIDRIYAYAPVPGVKWGLAVTVPVAEVTDAVSALTTITLATIVAVLLIAGIILTLLTRRIAKPIAVLEEAANRIAGGDISLIKLDINSKDEFGRLGGSFEQMTQNLRILIKGILGATEQVAASSEEMTASSEQLAQTANKISASIADVAAVTSEQLSAANETAVVVQQMSDSSQQMSSNANQVALQSAQAAEKAKDGEKAVSKAVDQMGQIENTVETSTLIVTKLGDRSKEIGQIVDTISGIAGQTNLLALNAAIEAARAGEQGKGFAVVAEEVRKLAEQSQEAAKKIAGLIGEIQVDTEKAVVAMNDGSREVKAGAEVVTLAGAAFREITNLVTQVAGNVKEISIAMQQMATGSQQIVGSVKKISDLGKKSAGEALEVSAAAEEQLSSMQEIASSSQSLAKLAQDLQTAVAGFHISG